MWSLDGNRLPRDTISIKRLILLSPLCVHVVVPVSSAARLLGWACLRLWWTPCLQHPRRFEAPPTDPLVLLRAHLALWRCAITVIHSQVHVCIGSGAVEVGCGGGHRAGRIHGALRSGVGGTLLRKLRPAGACVRKPCQTVLCMAQELAVALGYGVSDLAGGVGEVRARGGRLGRRV